MNLPDDDELRPLFESLREEDRRRAPAFRGALGHEWPQLLPRRRAFPLAWIAAAAGIVLTVGIAIRETRQHGPSAYVGSSGSFGGGDTVSISTTFGSQILVAALQAYNGMKMTITKEMAELMRQRRGDHVIVCMIQ